MIHEVNTGGDTLSQAYGANQAYQQNYLAASSIFVNALSLN
jgi:hypothetical protein